MLGSRCRPEAGKSDGKINANQKIPATNPTIFFNLQLQRQRCSRLQRFSKQNKIFFVFKNC
jgi:hypothetical protein